MTASYLLSLASVFSSSGTTSGLVAGSGNADPSAATGTPGGGPYNVAQAYARMADALRAGRSFDVDFNLAVQRHKLIDAIERSSATGRSVRLVQ